MKCTLRCSGYFFSPRRILAVVAVGVSHTYLEVFGKLLSSLVTRVHGDEVSHVPLEPDDLTVARKYELLRSDAFRVCDGQYLKNTEAESGAIKNRTRALSYRTPLCPKL